MPVEIVQKKQKIYETPQKRKILRNPRDNFKQCNSLYIGSLDTDIEEREETKYLIQNSFNFGENH